MPDASPVPRCSECNSLDVHERCNQCGNIECQHDACSQCGVSSCARGDVGPCSSCGYCSVCCACYHCERCETRFVRRRGNLCDHGVCASCNDCNVCEAEQEENEESSGDFLSNPLNRIINQKYQQKVHVDDLFLNGKLCKRVPFLRHMAAEIEVAGIERMTTFGPIHKAWGIQSVRDGSLPESGFELNLRPASGHLFSQQVRDISAALKVDGAIVTKDCGLHVHVNARDLSLWGLRKLARIYGEVEDGLFAIIDPSRRTNTYCHPCAMQVMSALGVGLAEPSNKSIRKAVHEWVYDFRPVEPLGANQKYIKGTLYRRDTRYPNASNRWVDTGAEHPHKYTNNYKREHRGTSARYWALNLHSWFFRGSIEFRMHHGTIDGEDILNWALLVGNMVEQASKPGVWTWTEANLLSRLRQLAPTDRCREWVNLKWAKYN